MALWVASPRSVCVRAPGVGVEWGRWAQEQKGRLWQGVGGWWGPAGVESGSISAGGGKGCLWEQAAPEAEKGLPLL